MAQIVLSGAAQAAVEDRINGDFVGSLGPTNLRLHIDTGTNGTLGGTLDSPDQGVEGLACADVHVDGRLLSFAVPVLHGTWSQGSPMPLTVTRDTFIAASKPSAVDGFWLGTLTWERHRVRIQIAVKSDAAGREYCTMDNLELKFFGLPCTNVRLDGANFSFDLPAASVHWSGVLSKDFRSLGGTWNGRGQPEQSLGFV